MQLLMSDCKRTLTVLWFIGSGVIFLMVLLQSILGHYYGKSNEAWGWLLPNIMPGLSLITGVMIIDAQNRQPKAETVDRFFF